MSNKEPKQEIKKQETEASSNDLYNPLKDAPPSSHSSTHQIGQLHYVPGNNDDIFLARLQKHVGPDLEKLINPDETPQQAYERHMQVIGAASRRITNQEQLVKWLENPAYANYYFPEKGFNRVIKNISDLRVAVDISTQSARRLIEYVLTDENDAVFARLFCSMAALQEFAANFSKKDVRRVIEGAFLNTDAFEGIFKDELALAKFKGSFPGYADQATNLFMLKRQTLNAIKYLRKRVEEGWGQRAPRVSPSSPDAGSGASSSNSIQTAVAGQILSAANDPIEKASKGQKQKLAVVIPASLFGKSALSGEVSPVTQNLSAANDIKPPKDHFSPVFSNTADGPAQVLQDFLDGESHKNLSQTSRANREIYDVETTYKKLLRENIGPDPARLRNADETYREAYERHLTIIRGLGPVNTQEELAERLAIHPDYYYFNRLVIENDFARFFVEDINGLINFCQDFPLHAGRVLEYVLTDTAVFRQAIIETIHLSELVNFPAAYIERFFDRALADADTFYMMTGDADELDTFANFPAVCVERLIERVFADVDAFARVTQSGADLQHTVMAFPAYAERFLERVLADADAFARVTRDPYGRGLRLEQIADLPAAYVERVIVQVLADAGAFALATRNASDLQRIATAFPAYAGRFLEQVLADANAFYRVISEASDLQRIVTTFPTYAERVIAQVLADADAFYRVTAEAYDLEAIASLPAVYVERFLERVLADADAFARLIRSAPHLQQIVALPAAYAERFLERVLSDTRDFAWVVRDKNDLKFFLECVAPSFPAHAKRAEALFAARETARAEAKHNAQPIQVNRAGPLSPTAPATDFEMFSSSANQARATEQNLLAVNDAKGETKEGPRQSTAKAYPLSPDTNISVSSSRVDQVTITVQASSAVNEAKEEMSGGQKQKLTVAIPASLFGKSQLLEALSPVIQKPPTANEVSNHDLENQSEPPKKGKCCRIL